MPSVNPSKRKVQCRLSDNSVCMTAPIDMATAVLTVDLGAIKENYHIVKNQLGALACAAAVKANAYGLGAIEVSRALASAGCKEFFVVSVDEGIELRSVLGEAPIHVLYGPMVGAEAALAEYHLTPVLNSLSDIERWSAEAKRLGRELTCDLHFCSGMNRTGFPAAEAAILAEEPGRLAGLTVDIVMSHLHSADVPGSPESARQLECFGDIRSNFPMGRASFANSSGIFLGGEYHFDLGRPGIALYGGNPTPSATNPMRGVIKLQGRILQTRTIATGDVVGYGAEFRATKMLRVATVPLGYADGYHRMLGNCGLTYIDGIPCPVLGRISMDLISIDVTAVPEDKTLPGTTVEIIGPNQDVEDIAVRAGTNSNEILTSLGSRFHRVYTGGY